MYSYHYQHSEIFRYDDTRHYPDLPRFPHPKHFEEEKNVVSVDPPDLSVVLREIESRMQAS